MPIATIDPTTGETVKVFDALSDSEVEARVALAAKAFAAFRVTTLANSACEDRMRCSHCEVRTV